MKFKARMHNVKTVKYSAKMILDVRDRPDIKSWIILAFQHVFAMFGATVLTPILINQAAGATVIGVDVALFSSGIGTLIYIAITKAKVPIYLGSSIAYIGTMGSLWPLYGNSMFFGLLGVGLIYGLTAFFIYLFGTGWLKRLLPPVVVGPMIIIIGLSLAPVAVNNIFINDFSKGYIFKNGDWNIDWWGVLVAIITFFSAILITLLCRGKIKLLPILSAMIIGLICSLIISTWYNGLNFTKYKDIDWATLTTYINVPNFQNSLFNGVVVGDSGHWSFLPFVLMMPLAFATIAEHIGDHTVLGKIMGRDYINGAPGLHKTLLGDGIATMAAGLIGGPANTSYGENTTTVALSRVGSVWVTGLAAIFAICMSFFQIIPTLLQLIPSHVLGGLGLVLFGFIASNGLKVLIDDKVDMFLPRNIFIISLMLIIGLGGAIVGFNINDLSITFSGTSIAMLIGGIFNLIIPQDRGINLDKMPKIKKRLS